ncbi:hypothetical protein EVAR_17701_1 [Eumeta japonica]|uniref:Mariner Mos1 transposase n=1 Tax=Eumeta variegata TaxID=151549 RepID=A0A4C1URQ8_EUMVA|nr:hypothetical protein EVAR_17701_1 [Eumeta japonica]
MTEDNVSAVRLMMEIDKRMICQQVRTSLGIGMGEVHKILHECLAVGKFCIWWIPHNLTDAQKLCRNNWCGEMVLTFAGGDSNAVYDMATGD